MSKQARIEDGVVAEVAVKEAEFEPGVFVKCGDEVEAGWHYARGEFSPPPPPAVKAVVPLWQAKLSAMAEMDRRAASLQTTACGGEASPMSSAAFAEAERWQAGRRDGDFPFLDARVGITAASRDEAAKQICDEHCKYCKHAAAIERYRLQLKKRLEAATTTRQLDEIIRTASWPIPDAPQGGT